MFSSYPRTLQRPLRPIKVEPLSPAARVLSMPLLRQAPVARREPALMLQAVQKQANKATQKAAPSRRDGQDGYLPVTTKARAGFNEADGYSSQPIDTSKLLKQHAPEFHAELDKIKKQEEWSVFSCAEPNALAELLKKKPTTQLADVRIDLARRDFQYLFPCENCSQWLESAGDDVYKIKKTFIPKKTTKAGFMEGIDDNNFPKLS